MMLHPEDSEGAAQRKVAAITGIEALGGGAKVCRQHLHVADLVLVSRQNVHMLYSLL